MRCMMREEEGEAGREKERQSGRNVLAREIAIPVLGANQQCYLSQKPDIDIWHAAVNLLAHQWSLRLSLPPPPPPLWSLQRELAWHGLLLKNLSYDMCGMSHDSVPNLLSPLSPSVYTDHEVLLFFLNPTDQSKGIVDHIHSNSAAIILHIIGTKQLTCHCHERAVVQRWFCHTLRGLPESVQA